METGGKCSPEPDGRPQNFEIVWVQLSILSHK